MSICFSDYSIAADQNDESIELDNRELIAARDYLIQLAQQWQLPFISAQELITEQPPFYLGFIKQSLHLISLAKDSPGPLMVDFVGGKNAHRRQFGGGKGQSIAKAVGLNKGFKPKVLDATAGLGKDAFVLASLGCELELIERSRPIAALLEDGLRRARQSPEISAIADNMHLLAGDSLTLLSQMQRKTVDIIYLDPMFPDKKSSALVKKDMQYLQQINGKDEDANQLLCLAIEQAKYRVVVKRPKGAPYLNGQKPQLELKTKGQRLDIYIKQKLPI